ncbi:MAG: Mth938-like domain-containing protein [Patescibacteria group bacterium]|nr:Mth938-like domain-containing protein [Patescibacteria group bacterium]
MSVRFDSTQFGSVTINGKQYKDVLVVGEEIIPRDLDVLHKRYGTGHKIAPEELDKLLDEKPAFLVIGTGQTGVLHIPDSVRKEVKDAEVDLIAKITPKAIENFNALREKGNRVNALIHVTC